MYESFIRDLIIHLNVWERLRFKSNKRWLEYLYWFLYKYLKSKKINNKDILLSKYKEIYLKWVTPLVEIEVDRSYIDKTSQPYNTEYYYKRVVSKINERRKQLWEI